MIHAARVVLALLISEHNDATCQKTLVLKQCGYWFSTILQSRLQTGIENINGLLRNAKD